VVIDHQHPNQADTSFCVSRSMQRSRWVAAVIAISLQPALNWRVIAKN
jgi:hypothetical protein